ncbi:MAG TPA: VCBS repeat-containing protein [Thermoanaerobaculia bacterium]|nr:VCBS repeat-containing protein [Thermoanaerobaculia bacterium]
MPIVKFPGYGTVIGSKPIMADLGLTPGFRSIIFATRNASPTPHTFWLFVIQHNANGSWGLAPGWPQPLPSHAYSSPAIGDINGDGIPEIVVGYGSTSETSNPGGIRAYSRNGTMLWDVPGGAAGLPPAGSFQGPDGLEHDPVQSTPAIGDIDGDGNPEVVWGGLDHHVYAVDGATGTPKPGWPVDVGDTVFSSPVLYDLLGDGKLEVIIGSDAYFTNPPGGCMNVLRFDGTRVNPWPKCIDQVVSNSPVVADIVGDGRPAIIHGTGTFWGPPNQPGTPTHAVYAWHADGTALSGWPVAVGGQVNSTPAIADLDGDGVPDVIVTDDNKGQSPNHVYAIKGNGTIMWTAQPKDFFGMTLSAGEPIVADMLGSTPGLNVLVPSNGEVVVFDATGVQLTETSPHQQPQKLSFAAQSSVDNVAVGELETNRSPGQKIDVLVVSAEPFGGGAPPPDTVVHVWNPVNRTETPPWGLWRHSPDRLGTTNSHLDCTTDSSAANFFTVQPCRVVDTRNAPGPYGGPALANNVLRDFVIGGKCGIPATAKAVSANVTVLNSTNSGDLRFGPGCRPPSASTTVWVGGETRGTEAAFALDAKGVATLHALVAGNGTVHVLVDVNGYYQ